MANTWTTANQTYNNTTYTIANGSSGALLTTNGINGTWTTNTTGYQLSPSVVVNNNPSSLEVKGKIIHNGIDLEERLKTIERVLAIPERDATMEAKYPSLKKKFDEYINTLEKYRTFERLKGEE